MAPLPAPGRRCAEVPPPARPQEATELFLQELIFEMSDYFLCVVNDFTSLDQRYLDRLTRNLENSTKVARPKHGLRAVAQSVPAAAAAADADAQSAIGGSR